MTAFGPYKATVAVIHDGDTLDVDIVLVSHTGRLAQDHDLGFNLHRSPAGVVLERQSVRLYGCNAPELATPAGKAALAFIETLVKVGDTVTLVSHGWDKFSRRRHFFELDYHLAKLKAAVRDGDPVRVLELAADLSNHSLFLADSEYALTRETFDRRRAEPSFVRPRAGVYLRLMLNPRWISKGWGGLRSRREDEMHEEPRLETAR